MADDSDLSKAETIIDGNKFNCDKCGKCCMHIDMVPGFSEMDDGTGRCKYLTEDNLCSIYEHRPNACRGTYMYYKYYQHMSVDDYYEMVRELCLKIKNNERLY